MTDFTDPVVLETMPDHLRASHRAAGNWGRYPLNGAERQIVEREEAEETVANDQDGYDSIIQSARYTYTIFDADPDASGPTAWPSHEDIEIEAESDADAKSQVLEILETEAAGLSPVDGYEVGQRIYALIWTPEETVVAKVSHKLTADELGTEGGAS